MSDLITLDEIEEARKGLPADIRWTPLVPFSRTSVEVGSEQLHLKLENLQVTGAYKPRAAFHILGSLSPDERRQGVVMSSSGNFAQAFAYAGKRLGVSVVVVMMEKTSPYKVEAIRGYGTEIVFCENNYLARRPMMEKVARERDCSSSIPPRIGGSPPATRGSAWRYSMTCRTWRPSLFPRARGA